MKTASWFAKLPEGHVQIGISRGVPRRTPAGYRVYRKLAPGPWFNSVGIEEYYARYKAEILAPLNPRVIAAELMDLAKGGIPVMLCYERPDTGTWCHRAMAAEWLAAALGKPVPEVGFETLAQELHPLMPPQLRMPKGMILPTRAADLTDLIGREATIGGERHRVVSDDPANPGQVVISVDDRRFSTSVETALRLFRGPP